MISSVKGSQVRDRHDRNKRATALKSGERWLGVASVVLAGVLLCSPVLAVAPAAATGPLACQQDFPEPELCLAPGVRTGTFVVFDRRDRTIIASIPSDPEACPEQTFAVNFEFHQKDQTRILNQRFQSQAP